MQRSHYRWLILAMAFLAGVTCMGWIWLTFPLFIPKIAPELGLTAARAQFLFGAISLSLLVSGFLGGTVGTHYSPRWTVGLGILLVGISALIRGFPLGYYGLVGTSLLTGLGLGFVVPNLVHTLGIWFPPRELGFANGVRMTGERIGAALAQGILVGTLMGLFHDWRPVQAILGCAALTVALIWLIFYRSPEPEANDRATSPGSNLKELWEESRASLGALFSDPALLLLALVVSIHSYSFFSYLGLLPTWLLDLPFVTEQTLGQYNSLVFWALVVGGLAIPTLTDLVEDRRVVLIPVSLVIGAGMVLTGWAGSRWVLVLVLSVTGLAAGGLIPLAFTLINERMNEGPNSQSAEAGFLLSVSQPGGVFGPSVGGYLFEHYGVGVSALVVGVPIFLVGLVLLVIVCRPGEG